MLGIGVIGAGYWGPNLVRNFASFDGCDLRCVCDLSADRLQSVRRNYPSVATTDSLQDLIDDDDVQGVAIATPVNSHFDIASRLLTAGKSVLVEKPLTRSAAECERLIEMADKTGAVLMVGHTFEFNAAVEHVERLIDERQLGDIHYIYSQRLNLGIVRQDVDAMWNLAPHDISIALRWLKQMPATVRATGYTYLQDGIADVVFVNLEFADGVAVHIHVSWLDPGKVRRMTVVGSGKMVVYDDVSTEAKIQVFDKGIDREHLDDSLGDFDSFGKFQLTQRAGDVLIPKLDFVEPLARECAHFVDCISTASKPLTDGANGLRVVRVLEAATQSLRAGGAAVAIS